LDWGLAALFLVVFIIELVSFDAYTKANPHGRYDAWAIWNVRARMIARGGEHWKSVFIPQVFHADYPLLVPLSIARSWVLAGTESQRIPPAVAGLFTFASSGILAGALLSLRKKQSAWLAGIILLTTPWFVYFGSLQFADLPLAACILSASACLCMALMDRPSSLRWFLLAGLSAGLAAWVKNEGQLFLLVFAIVTTAVILFSYHKKERLPVLLNVIYGLILPLSVIVLFKLTLAPANDVVDTGNLGQSMSQLLSLPRYGEVINAYLNYPKGFGGWTFPLPLVFLLFWILMGPVVNKENRAAIFSLSGLLALQWIGYFLIFVITPHALQTHINQSYDRLLMHIYPSFLLFLFLFLPPLEMAAIPWLNSKNTPAV
jgi:4-amino-4-deoxy-L-arabinose transferase-like glycosyltransferase